LANHARRIPPHRPWYKNTGTDNEEAVVIELKSADEIGRMAVAGQFVGELLAELKGVAAVGVNLMDIEHHARRRIEERGAESCYWDYAPSFGRGPFRNVLCLSVNDAVLHGLPHDYVLRDGDLLSIDMALGIDGWVADSALSFVVGTPDPADLKLIEATEVALEAGIAAAQPGGRLGDVSAAIGEVAHSYGYAVNGEFGGHGIGRTMHEAPHVANSGRPRRGMKLDPGLALAIEPWLCRSTDKIRYDPDGWTIRSADGSRTAHSEHTVAITAAGPRVLTRRPTGDAAPAGPAENSATAS
jgi:methionyl aminopeptidase